MAEQHQLDPVIQPDELTATLASVEPILPGVKRWGDFQLLQRLGQGAFGEVYRAWDPVLEREVALKLLLPRGLDLEQEYLSIVAEARAIARVRHPNIVSVYGVDRRDGRVGFWSDYVRGRTLSSIVEMEGPLSADATARAGIALAEALAAVHGAGLLHRDIKASNAMRDENGRVLLMDFGLSQDAHNAAQPAGTPKYMAPELLTGVPATVQSDLYALGILIHYLAMGKYPRVPRSAEARLDAEVPRELREVIAKAIRRAPQDRYLNAKKMCEALTATLAASQAALQTAPPSSGEAKPAKRAAEERPRWKRYIGLAIGAFFIFSPWVKTLVRTKRAGTSPASYQDYLAAQSALERYDKPGNTQRAITLYQRTLAKSPDFALADAGLARASWRMYLDTSDNTWVDAANTASDKAMSLNPNLAEVEMTAGSLHVDQGKVDLGMQELQKALALDGRSAEVHAALGEAYREQGRIEDAKTELQSAIDLGDDNWRWPYLLGALELDAGDIKAAQESLQSALEKTPDNARVLYNLGVANWRLNRLADAGDDLKRAIAIAPTLKPVLALGSVLLLQGKYPAAIDAFRRAVELNPSSWKAWGTLGEAYEWNSEDSSEAASAFRKAIELSSDDLKNSPENADVVSRVAEFHASLREEKEALPLLRKSLLLAPRNPDVLERAATSYEALGRRTEALKYVDQALQLGWSVEYAKKVPSLSALRKDPRAPEAIRE